MQLHLHLFWYFAATHDNAHWGETFQVQPMRQSLHTKEQAHKTFPTSHDLGLNLSKPMWKILQTETSSDKTFPTPYNLGLDQSLHTTEQAQKHFVIHFI